MDDLLQVGLVGTVVHGIRNQGHVASGDPFRHLESRVRNDVFQPGPFTLVLFDLPWRYGQRVAIGYDIGKVRRGLLRLDDQREIVGGADAQLGQVLDLAAVDGPGVLEVVVEEPVGVGLLRVQHAAEGIDEVMGRDGPAVAPPRAAPKVEGPGLAVRGGFIAVGGRGFRIPVRIAPEQRLEGNDGVFRVVIVYRGIERAGLRAHVPEDLLVPRGGVRRKGPRGRFPGTALRRDQQGSQEEGGNGAEQDGSALDRMGHGSDPVWCGCCVNYDRVSSSVPATASTRPSICDSSMAAERQFMARPFDR